MEKSDPVYWEPYVAALCEVCEQWAVDKAFNDFFARAVLSYLKPRWMVHEKLQGFDYWLRCVTHFTMGDTQMLASGGADGTVKVWRCDAYTQRCGAHKTPEAHTGRGWCVTHRKVKCITHFTMGDTHMLASGSLDDTHMLVGGSKGTLRVWRCDADTQQWGAHATLEGHNGGVTCMTHFTMGDTHMLASGSEDRTV